MLAKRNAFESMLEIITTHDDTGEGDQVIRLHPWAYELLSQHSMPSAVPLHVVPGVSPVREALTVQGALPEQRLSRWSESRLEDVRLQSAESIPEMLDAREPAGFIGEHLLQKAQRLLQEDSGGRIEVHEEKFGSILVVPVEGASHVAFAIGRTWPYEVLEVDWINRETRHAEIIATEESVSCLDPRKLIDVYKEAVKSRRRG